MAEVFAGELVGTQEFARPVAIKRILPGYAQNPAFVAQFSSEAQLTARLRHPNIVETLDFSRDADGSLVLVMELVQGVTLAALMATGPVPPAVAAFLVAEMLRGLGHAHGQRLVHRDVSPHNVLLSWEGAVKVSDFGIAKARDASEASASVVLKGKPAYMSPEQASARPLDERSDLFAVGVVLWELLANRSLFKADDTRATLAAVLFGTVPPPGGPKDLARVAMKLLEKDREKRYPSADAVLADLGRYQLGEQGRQALVAHLSRSFTGSSLKQSRSRWPLLSVLIAAVTVSTTLIARSLDGPVPDSEVSVRPSLRSVPEDVRLYDDLSLIPLGKQDMWERAPVFRWPQRFPKVCIDVFAALHRMHDCGKLDTYDRDELRRVILMRGNDLIEMWSDARRPRVEIECRRASARVASSPIKLFIDCRFSMNEDDKVP